MKPDFEHIDDLFRKGLDQPSAPSHDWDSPSDDVWKGVEAHLSAKRRRRGLWWWLAPALFVVLAALSLYVARGTNVPVDLPEQAITSDFDQNTSEDNEMSGDAVAEIETDGTQITAGVGDTRTEEDAQANTSQAETGDSQEEVKLTESPQVVASSGAGHHRDQDEDGKVDSGSDRRANVAEGLSRQSEQPTHKDHVASTRNSGEQVTSDESSVQTRTAGQSGSLSDDKRNAQMPDAINRAEERVVSEMAFLTQKPMQVDWLPREFEPITPVPSSQDDPCAGVWTVSGFIAPSLGTRRIVVPKTRPDVLRDRLVRQERPVMQLGFGLAVDRKLNARWSVSGGVEYNSYVVETSGRHQIRFTRFGERLNDRGNLENTLDLNLNTSYGDLNAGVIIERSPASNIDEHSFINVDLKARQSMHVIQVPVSVKYHFPIGSFNGFVHGGVSGNVLVKDRFEASVIRSVRSDVFNIRVADRTNIKGTRGLALGYQFGLGIEKKLNCHWAVSLEPTLSGYIQPVYSNNAVSVYPTQFDLHVGMHYKW